MLQMTVIVCVVVAVVLVALGQPKPLLGEGSAGQRHTTDVGDTDWFKDYMEQKDGEDQDQLDVGLGSAE
jgi:hypothetical protein